VKIPTTPKKNKKKEKVIEPREEMTEHINFHSSFELNGDVHFFYSCFESTEKKKRGQIGPKVSRSGQVYQDMGKQKSKGGQDVQRVFGLP